jgi:hypothetical protein
MKLFKTLPVRFQEFSALFVTASTDKEYCCFAPCAKSNITEASRQDIDYLLFGAVFCYLTISTRITMQV